MKASPILFVSHGGGPLPLLGRDEIHRKHLVNISEEIEEKPKALIVVSAHWEADPIRISAQVKPDLFFDYYGFPKESYSYRYPVAGNPQLAARILTTIQDQGLEATLDSERGLDHGVFIPLMLAFPQADIPVVAVSLHASLDPRKNAKIGKALKTFRKENCLIIASGLTFHDLRALDFTATTAVCGLEFDAALRNILLDPTSSASQRLQKLVHWKQIPGAREAHPREEHLLPLLVAAAAATDEDSTPKLLLNDTFFNAKVSAFRFG